MIYLLFHSNILYLHHTGSIVFLRYNTVLLQFIFTRDASDTRPPPPNRPRWPKSTAAASRRAVAAGLTPLAVFAAPLLHLLDPHRLSERSTQTVRNTSRRRRRDRKGTTSRPARPAVAWPVVRRVRFPSSKRRRRKNAADVVVVVRRRSRCCSCCCPPLHKHIFVGSSYALYK